MIIMGQTYSCDGCEAEPAVMSLSNLVNGDVQFVGTACLPVYLRAVADTVEQATMTPDEPIGLLPTDSASPPYDPDSGTVTTPDDAPATAPPQPTTDPGAGGTGEPTIDHGTEDEQPAPSTGPAAVPDGSGVAGDDVDVPGDGAAGSPAGVPDTAPTEAAPSLLPV